MTHQQVHLRVNDAATGKPTPVRLRITDAAGTYYAPYGRLTEFATGVNQDVGGNVLIGAKKWAYIDGTCEILLPPGSLHIEIAKGPEYKPIDEDIQLLVGKMSLRFTIERWSDVRKQGWYSGDSHVRNIMPHAALLEGQAEDIAVVNLLAHALVSFTCDGEPTSAISNLLAFSGQRFLLEEAGTGVAVNTRNHGGMLGALSLLHCHRVVFPLTTGLNRSDNDHWTLDDWCDQCHRKAGLVVWSRLDMERDGAELWGEALADAIRGKIDAFEIDYKWCANDPADWQLQASAGFPLPLVAGSGKDSNGVPMGAMRTYAHIPPDTPLTYSAWIDAVRSGRTFISDHPLLFLTIDGQTPSTAAVEVPASKRLKLRAEAASWFPIELLFLCVDSKPIASCSSRTGPPYKAVIEIEHAMHESGLVSAWVETSDARFACTSFQQVKVDGRPPVNAAAVRMLDDHVARMRHWAANDARCDTPRHRDRLVRIYDEARTALAMKLS